MKQRQGSTIDNQRDEKSDFQTFKPTIIASSILLALVTLAGCGKPSSDTSSLSSPQGTGSSDTTPPRTLALTPTIGAPNVPVDKTMAADFSEPLNSNTISSASFFLLSGDLSDKTAAHLPVQGTVSYAEDSTLFTSLDPTTFTTYVATLKPNADLAPNTTYSLLTTKAITDVAGNRLDQFIPVVFTTAAKSTVDTTPPTVSDTLPANKAVDIAVNRSIVVTFSEPVNNVDTNSFTLYDSSNNQVSGSITDSGNNRFTFTPDASLDYDTVYTATITTSVTDITGNALSTDYTWTFTTASQTTPPDTTPPGVSVVTPRNNAIDIATNSAISASFDEALDPTTVTDSSFIVTSGGTTVSGVVSYSGTTATFKPNAELATNTVYTVTLTTAITDIAGNNLAANYSWSFTTAAPATATTPPPQDTTPPSVTSVTPANGTVDVTINSAVSVDFSEALDPATVNTASFLLTGGTSGTVVGTVSYNGTSATFTPLSPLENSTTYTAILTSSITDLAGNTLVSNYAWSFTTAAPATPPDTTPPAIVDGTQAPAVNATGVATNTAISVGFTESLSPGTVTTSTFQLKAGNTVIPGSVRYSGTTATFTPLSALQNSTAYTASLSSGITDLAGNALVPTSWIFTTAAPATPPDQTPPAVVTQTPAPGATNVPVTTNAISAQFNEALDPSTVTTASVVLSVGGFSVAGSVLYSNDTITFVPSANLAFNSVYTITIKKTVTDLAGNALTSNISWSFTTAQAPNNGMGGGGQGGGGGGGM